MSQIALEPLRCTAVGRTAPSPGACLLPAPNSPFRRRDDNTPLTARGPASCLSQKLHGLSIIKCPGETQGWRRFSLGVRSSVSRAVLGGYVVWLSGVACSHFVGEARTQCVQRHPLFVRTETYLSTTNCQTRHNDFSEIIPFFTLVATESNADYPRKQSKNQRKPCQLYRNYPGACC
jgi:hypothetical protein